MRAILRMAWLCLALVLPALPASAGSMKNETGAITARLDALKAPALGGAGEVIWAGIPSVQPEAAELTFAIEKPGHAAPEMRTQRLALTRGRASEASCALEAARPGQYRVTATLALIVGGKTLVDERSLTLTVGMGQKTMVRAAAEDEIYIPTLTIDAVEPTAGWLTNVDYKRAVNWFQIDVTTTGTYRIELSGIAPALTQSKHLYIGVFGPNSGEQFVGLYGDAAASGAMQYGLALKKPGIYYLKVFVQRAGLAFGDFNIRVSKLSAQPPAITRLAINNGAEVSYEHDVTLNNECTGAPAYYITDVANAVNETNFGPVFDWKPYSTAPRYRLSGAGVTMLVKSADGLVSEPASDTIKQINYTWLRGDRITHYDYVAEQNVKRYQFTLDTATYCDLWADQVALRLYGPDSQTKLVAKSGAITSSTEPARIIKKLPKGHYWIVVQSRRPGAGTSYGIRLTLSPDILVADYNIKNVSTVDGNPFVYTRELKLASRIVGNKPVEFKASTSSRFSGAKWQAYKPEAVCTMPAGDGAKVIYFKVRDARGNESRAVTASVFLKERKNLELGKKVRGEIEEAPGDSLPDVYVFKVKTAGQYMFEWKSVDSLPYNDEDHILIALEALDGLNDAAKVITHREGEAWKTTSYRWGADLKPGTYYFRVRGWSQDWGTPYYGKYELQISPFSGPIKLQSFRGASTKTCRYSSEFWVRTASRKIQLNSYVLGKPKYYKVSESKWFTNAEWKPYAPSVEYTLSAGNGRKNLYFKVMDGRGRATRWEFDTVELDEAMMLIVDGAALAGERKLTAPQYYQFTVSKAGAYTVRMAKGLKASNGLRFELSGEADWNAIAGEDLSTTGNKAMRYTLQPGTYYITAPPANVEQPEDGNFEPYLSDYTMSVTSK